MTKNQGNRKGWHQEGGTSLSCSRKVVFKFSIQHTQGMQTDTPSSATVALATVVLGKDTSGETPE